MELGIIWHSNPIRKWNTHATKTSQQIKFFLQRKILQNQHRFFRILFALYLFEHNQQCFKWKLKVVTCKYSDIKKKRNSRALFFQIDIVVEKLNEPWFQGVSGIVIEFHEANQSLTLKASWEWSNVLYVSFLENEL